ncbi:MAG: branched-chain amino acid aminotransferase [bacterium]|nr:branched-chain amino acid aminotransferase [bacterium]
MADQPYDDRDGIIWIDGELVPWRDAKLHILTHALHYGSGVFEGARVYNGEIFKLNEHSMRLHESAKYLDFEIPWSVEEINQACRDTVKAQGLVDGYVRPIAWRGSEDMGISAPHTKIHLSISAWEWGSYFDPEQKMKGITLRIADYKRPDPATAPTKAKAAGLYMICTIEKHKADRLGFADAFFLDWRGQVAEATGANVFFVKGDVLHTPIPDCILDGITRRTVIGLAKNRGLEVVQRVIMPEDMAEFDQCFLTGSAAEVTPVSQIGDYRFVPGDITRTLLDDYARLVRGEQA